VLRQVPLRTGWTIKTYVAPQLQALKIGKMMKIPITIITEPRAFSKDVFSSSSKMAVSVEKSGVTEGCWHCSIFFGESKTIAWKAPT
jgi:hypothetical protein